MKFRSVLGILAFCALFAANASAEMLFTGTLSGANENPANGSPATGSVSLLFNDDLSLMTLSIDWSGITGGLPSAAHIHCCAPQGTNVGVAVGFPNFPAANSGSYLATFNLLNPAIYTAGFLNNFGGGTAQGARDALIAGLLNGQAYANIHDTLFPGGEVRANLSQSPVPLPAAAWLLISGVGLLGAARRRRAPI